MPGHCILVAWKGMRGVTAVLFVRIPEGFPINFDFEGIDLDSDTLEVMMPFDGHLRGCTNLTPDLACHRKNPRTRLRLLAPPNVESRLRQLPQPETRQRFSLQRKWPDEVDVVQKEDDSRPKEVIFSGGGGE